MGDKNPSQQLGPGRPHRCASDASNRFGPSVVDIDTSDGYSAEDMGSDSDFTVVSSRRLKKKIRRTSLTGRQPPKKESGMPSYTFSYVPTSTTDILNSLNRQSLTEYFELVAPGQVEEIRINAQKNILSLEVNTKTILDTLKAIGQLGNIPVRAFSAYDKETTTGVIYDVDEDITDSSLDHVGPKFGKWITFFNVLCDVHAYACFGLVRPLTPPAPASVEVSPGELDMDVIEVEGEDITPEVMQDPGWIAAHEKRHRSGKLNNEQGERQVKKPAITAQYKSDVRIRQPPTAPKQPQLPHDDFKIVIRPRGGFDAARLHTVVVRDGVLLGADLTHEAARDDTLRINARQNTLTMSTPVKDNAIKYSKLEEIRIGNQTYAAAAYITAPEDTSKGVIHGVPENESQEVIEKSLVTDRNPTILHARRMGRTNSIVIVFEGTHVPHYVYYQTTVGENPARAAETQRRRPDEPLERAAEPQQH
ncbi:hypothetical protein HPB49_021477 [Dermacentor silvarum]|uniref:Uncharacterized protein n=1 Tax=Dermacentor silvarum TaxID=543639 RepID=A0ACB8CB69_DERSI|nr:hypothetical protein HPB49_021477 [Dermacentor silvarum]